jgi:acyl-CoA thioesterase I
MARPIRIVTLGDSLTTGYQSPGPDHFLGASTPYGEFLRDLLGDTAEVLVRGVNGELTGEMALRLGADVISLKPDYVVILGGTNDLGWGAPPHDIMRNIGAMYERALGAGIQAVAVTVPSIRGLDQMIPPRLLLNRLIVEYGRNRSLPCVDLFTATAEPETQRLAESYSNDGLHLTTDGYRLLAEMLYDQVFRPRLQKDGPAGILEP